MPIRKLKARQILDARGQPTVEVDLITDIGLLRSSVPSSLFQANDNEAKEIRDGDEAVYGGRAVTKVVNSINNIIAPELLKSKLEVNQQREIDLLLQTLDGTPDKSKLGRNAMLGVSVAVCKAAAAKRGLPLYKYIAMLSENEDIYLPVPLFSVMSGGRGVGNSFVYQEFLILPTGAQNFAEAMRMGSEIYRALELKLAELQELQPPLGIGDKGSFMPVLEDDKEALSTLDEAIKEAGYEGKVKIGLDVAASKFCVEGKYDLQYKTGESDPEDHLEGEAFREQYAELLTEFPTIISLEDPFDQEDWDSWSAFTEEKPEMQIVADELTVTNVERLNEAIEKQAANCLVIKIGQIGTMSEALECVKMAREAGWGCLVSAGNCETEETFIADFAVGISAGQIKAGAPCRGERIAKYNQVLRIEEELAQKAKYAGENFRNPLAPA